MVKVDRILILGSTYLTELVVNKIKDSYNLIGYVPSVNPTREGKIDLPVLSIDSECDIKLSVQYDKIIKDTKNCYNVHTGLLPEYGGTNILDYTLRNQEYEQGLTFHKMTKDLDFGPIISKITYPVFGDDTAFDLYKRVLAVGPSFVESSLNLLQSLNLTEVNECFTAKPTLYKRGEFEADKRIKSSVL